MCSSSVKHSGEQGNLSPGFVGGWGGGGGGWLLF